MANQGASLRSEKQDVRIDGIAYSVIERRPVEDVRRRWPNTARHMEALGYAADLTLRRPRGARLFQAYERRDGSMTRVVMVA